MKITTNTAVMLHPIKAAMLSTRLQAGHMPVPASQWSGQTNFPHLRQDWLAGLGQ
jgi:hypothetical protein